MKISTILDNIDIGAMALPEFQRGYVWNRDQVRNLMDSLYRRHPVGSLLVWVTESKGAETRGDGALAPGVVKLLLDGQQRMTSLYGIVRGKPPQFFDGNDQAFTGLRFHVENQEFAFYQPIKMKDDRLWIDVSELMQAGTDGLGAYLAQFAAAPALTPKVGSYAGRLSQLLGIREIDLHVEEVTGADKSVDVVVDIFNRVNSGGTKLSKGDFALAKICAEWAAARDTMKAALARWRAVDFHFSLDWLLRNVNTVTTGEALFGALHDVPAERFQEGLKRGEKAVDYLLNVVSGRLGLDHDRVLFGRYAFPVMARYVDRRGGRLGDAREQDRLLFWYLHSALWGRFSGSTETVINQDLKVLEDLEGGIDRLIQELRLWCGDLTIRPAHFGGWSLGARFYPMLYLLTRVGEARDWGTGLPLKSGLLGKLNRLEVHHIFPRALLYKRGYARPQVNAVANFCFLTQGTNLSIRDTAPEVYFEKRDRPSGGARQPVDSLGPEPVARGALSRLPGGPQGPSGGGRECPLGGAVPRARRDAGRRGAGVRRASPWGACRRRAGAGGRCRRGGKRGGRTAALGPAGLGRGAGPSRRRVRVRIGRPRDRGGDGDPRPRLAERPAGGSQRARRAAVGRGAGDPRHRQSGGIPVLHRHRLVQALRAAGIADFGELRSREQIAPSPPVGSGREVRRMTLGSTRHVGWVNGSSLYASDSILEGVEIRFPSLREGDRGGRSRQWRAARLPSICERT